MDHSRQDSAVGALGDEAMLDRQEIRDSLFLAASLRVGLAMDARQVRVRNLSAGGLMAEVASPIPPNTPVEIDVRGIGPVNGRIAWNAAGRVGIAFDSPIDPRAARKPVGGMASPRAF